MDVMNARERVLAAINHELPDRIPMDFSALDEVWEALLIRLGLPDRDSLLDFLGTDLRYIEPIEIIYDRHRYIGPPLATGPNGAWQDIWGVWRRPVHYEHGVYQEIFRYPLEGVEEVESLLDRPWPQPDWYDYSDIADQCRRYHGKYALVGGGWGAVFGDAYRVLGLEHFLESVLLAPDIIREVVRRVETFYLGVNERIFEAAAGMLDIYYFGNDLGTQRALLMSPAAIREFLSPSFQRLVDQAKSYGLKVMFHSCGAIREAIPLIIEVGVDVLDPVQAGAAGMAPAGLKAEFGDRLAFHGGLDTQGVLPFGSALDVAAATTRLVEAMKPGGGYIFGPSQELQPDVPLDNILAMYRTCREVGQY
jgi:uroporphyrinogen decarboxylase